MKESCYFLKEGAVGQLGCAAGVNFYSVGQARGVCRAALWQTWAMLRFAST